MTLLNRIISSVDPDVLTGDSIDIRQYIKIKSIPGGTLNDCSYINGIVFRKNVSHKKMLVNKRKKNPRILLLSSGIEFHKQNSNFKLLSMDMLIEQEEKFLQIIIEKIMLLKPDIIVVGKSISRYAQELFNNYNVVIFQNVKEVVLERLARMTSGILLPSIDHIMLQQYGEECLGTCKYFDIINVQDNPEKDINSTKILRTKVARGSSYVYFSGCPESLGCSIILRGDNDRKILKVMKRILRFISMVAYHLRLEISYYHDRRAVLPYELIETNYEDDDELVEDSDSKIENHKYNIEEKHIKNITNNFNEEDIFDSDDEEDLSDSEEIVDDENEEDEIKHLTGYEDSSDIDDNGLEVRPDSNPIIFSFIDNNPSLKSLKFRNSLSTSLDIDCNLPYRNELYGTHLFRTKNLNRPNIDSHQTLLISSILMGDVNPYTNIPTQKTPADLKGIKFYTKHDVALGYFLIENCFQLTQLNRNPTVHKSIEQNMSFVHRSGRIDISVQKIPDRINTSTSSNVTSSTSMNSIPSSVQRPSLISESLSTEPQTPSQSTTKNADKDSTSNDLLTKIVSSSEFQNHLQQLQQQQKEFQQQHQQLLLQQVYPISIDSSASTNIQSTNPSATVSSPYHTPIYFSSYCKRCSKLVVPPSLLSSDTWKLSFGKFLEISLYNASAKCTNSKCFHSIRDDHVALFHIGGIPSAIHISTEEEIAGSSVGLTSNLTSGSGIIVAFSYHPVHPYSLNIRRFVEFPSEFYNKHNNLILATLPEKHTVLIEEFRVSVVKVMEVIQEVMMMMKKSMLMRNIDLILVSTAMQMMKIDLVLSSYIFYEILYRVYLSIKAERIKSKGETSEGQEPLDPNDECMLNDLERVKVLLDEKKKNVINDMRVMLLLGLNNINNLLSSQPLTTRTTIPVRIDEDKEEEPSQDQEEEFPKNDDESVSSSSTMPTTSLSFEDFPTELVTKLLEERLEKILSNFNFENSGKFPTVLYRDVFLSARHWNAHLEIVHKFLESSKAYAINLLQHQHNQSASIATAELEEHEEDYHISKRQLVDLLASDFEKFPQSLELLIYFDKSAKLLVKEMTSSLRNNSVVSSARRTESSASDVSSLPNFSVDHVNSIELAINAPVEYDNSGSFSYNSSLNLESLSFSDSIISSVKGRWKQNLLKTVMDYGFKPSDAAFNHIYQSTVAPTSSNKMGKVSKAIARLLNNVGGNLNNDDHKHNQVHLDEFGYGRLGLKPGSNGEVIAVNEDVFASIIAYSISSSEYLYDLQESIKNDLNEDNESVSAQFRDSNVNMSSDGTPDISQDTNRKRLQSGGSILSDCDEVSDEEDGSDDDDVENVSSNVNDYGNLMKKFNNHDESTAPIPSVSSFRLFDSQNEEVNSPSKTLTPSVSENQETKLPSQPSTTPLVSSHSNQVNSPTHHTISPTLTQTHSIRHTINPNEKQLISQDKSNIRVRFDDYDDNGNVICKFNCQIFWAKQFEALRHCFFIEDKTTAASSPAFPLDHTSPTRESYIRSLALSASWATQGGKSGASFAKTLDDRLVIKVISKVELQMFLDFAPAYFEYMAKAYYHNLPTVLCKVLGIYTIKSDNKETGKKTSENIVVMENIFYQRNITKTFDLKGSSRTRYSEIIGPKFDSYDTLIAKRRFCRNKLREINDKIAKLFINKQTEINKKVINKKELKKLLNKNEKKKLRDLIQKKNILLKNNMNINHVSSHSQVLLDDNLMEYTSGKPFPLKHRAKLFFNKAVQNDTLFLSIVNVVDYSILVGFDENSSQLVVGIIDFLRQYDIIKKMERVGKGSVGMLTGQAEPTIIQPTNYRRRFTLALDKYFMAVPDKWVQYDANNQ